MLFTIAYYGLGICGIIKFFFTYIIELSLSLDNVLVFLFIFKNLKINYKYQNKILMIGIISAVLFRIIAIVISVNIINLINRVRYTICILGIILVYIGVNIHCCNNKLYNKNENNNNILIFLNKFVKIDYNNILNFFYIKKKNFNITRIGVSLIFIEQIDIIFAIDSISTTIVASNNIFIIIAANILSILKLRHLYSISSAIINHLYALQTFLSCTLIITGINILLNYLLDIFYICRKLIYL